MITCLFVLEEVNDGRFVGFHVSTVIKLENLVRYADMSKAIDDPVIVSVPADLFQEGTIKQAIASSTNDYCCNFIFNGLMSSYARFPNSCLEGVHTGDVDGRQFNGFDRFL